MQRGKKNQKAHRQQLFNWKKELAVVLKVAQMEQLTLRGRV